MQTSLLFRSPCTNFVHRKQLDGLSLAPSWSMRKVRATQSIPLVNVQGVGDGRVDVEENNRLVSEVRVRRWGKSPPVGVVTS